jgi:hypothetical protein
MIQISDTGGCEMRLVRNGVSEYYSYADIKSVSPYKNANGEFIIIFNFINESRDSTLRLPLALIDNQPTWTDVNLAIIDIQGWMGACNSTTALATEATLQNVQIDTTGIVLNTTPANRTANIRRYANVTGSIVRPFSFSVANVGAATGTLMTVNLLPNEIVNFDAGALNNEFQVIPFDATGTEFLITWVD